MLVHVPVNTVVYSRLLALARATPGRPYERRAGRAGAGQGTVRRVAMRAPPRVTSRRVHTWQVGPGPAVRDPRACLGGDGAAARAGSDVGRRDQVAVPALPAMRCSTEREPLVSSSPNVPGPDLASSRHSSAYPASSGSWRRRQPLSSSTQHHTSPADRSNPNIRRRCPAVVRSPHRAVRYTTRGASGARFLGMPPSSTTRRQNHLTPRNQNAHPYDSELTDRSVSPRPLARRATPRPGS
jgi:hypothetical protein